MHSIISNNESAFTKFIKKLMHDYILNISRFALHDIEKLMLSLNKSKTISFTMNNDSSNFFENNDYLEFLKEKEK